MTDLRGLILQVQREHGLAYSDLLARAHAAGYRFLSKASLSKIVHRPLRTFPRPETMLALAAALDVPPSVVVAAVASGFGIHVPLRPTARWRPLR